jgi:hypothetical protein
MKKKSGSGRLSSNGTDIGRRTILKSAALVVGASAAMQSCNSAGNEPSASASYEVGDSSVIVRAGTAVVETESGKNNPDFKLMTEAELEAKVQRRSYRHSVTVRPAPSRMNCGLALRVLRSARQLLSRQPSRRL